ARQGVGEEVLILPGRFRQLDTEQLPHPVVMLAASSQAAEHAHQREARDTGDVGGALPHVRLVDQRPTHVEDDDVYSHEATRSRSARVVTLSSRSSPSTAATRPPTASTSDAQSVARSRSSPARSSAARRIEALNACG